MTKNTYLKKQILLAVLFVIFLGIGVFLLSKGLYHEKKISLKYRENNNINYKVYLKDNDFFETPYIEEGKTYITSLIDHIHIDFNYNIEFDHSVTGKYTHYVVARVEANKSDNEIGNYWTKNYNITDEKTDKINNASNYLVMESVDVDYNKYNEILNEFKKSVGLASSDGILKVYLVVNSDVEGNNVKTPIKSELMLKLPLSQLSIEASIDSDAENTVKDITKSVKETNKIYTLCLVSGILFILLSLFNVILFIKYKKINDNNNLYQKKIKKILSTYDSVIVNINVMPKMTDYNIINVESFEELIDAHSEVRMPINYYHTDNMSVFLLFNENTVWKYVLKATRKRSAKNEK